METGDMKTSLALADNANIVAGDPAKWTRSEIELWQERYTYNSGRAVNMREVEKAARVHAETFERHADVAANALISLGAKPGN